MESLLMPWVNSEYYYSTLDDEPSNAKLTEEVVRIRYTHTLGDILNPDAKYRIIDGEIYEVRSGVPERFK